MNQDSSVSQDFPIDQDSSDSQDLSATDIPPASRISDVNDSTTLRLPTIYDVRNIAHSTSTMRHLGWPGGFRRLNSPDDEWIWVDDEDLATSHDDEDNEVGTTSAQHTS